jgi:hypothetical protein
LWLVRPIDYTALAPRFQFDTKKQRPGIGDADAQQQHFHSIAALKTRLFQSETLFFETPKHLFDLKPAAIAFQVIFVRSQRRQQILGFVLGIKTTPATVETHTQIGQIAQASIVFKINRASLCATMT